MTISPAEAMRRERIQGRVTRIMLSRQRLIARLKGEDAKPPDWRMGRGPAMAALARLKEYDEALENLQKHGVERLPVAVSRPGVSIDVPTGKVTFEEKGTE